MRTQAQLELTRGTVEAIVVETHVTFIPKHEAEKLDGQDHACLTSLVRARAQLPTRGTVEAIVVETEGGAENTPQLPMGHRWEARSRREMRHRSPLYKFRNLLLLLHMCMPACSCVRPSTTFWASLMASSFGQER
eukprot:1138036-Pelagomonas_calceolata.AAC.7